MTRWLYRLEVGDIFRSDVPPAEKFPVIADRTEALARTMPPRMAGDFLAVASEIRVAENAEEFDEWWHQLYDLADHYRVWVNTFTAKEES